MPRGLDTYYGRRILRIDEDSDGNWFVELQGGVRIINRDKNKKKPKVDSPESSVFVTTVMHQDYTHMVLRSGVDGESWRIEFNPLEYQIFDPEQQKEPWSPQAGGYGVEIPNLRDMPDPDELRQQEAVQEAQPEVEEQPKEQPKKTSKKKKKAE